MSKIRVDSIEGDSNNAVTVSFGATVPSGTSCIIGDGLNVSGVITASSLRSSFINATGIVTAGFYYGDGSNLTNIPSVSPAKTIAYSIII